MHGFEQKPNGHLYIDNKSAYQIQDEEFHNLLPDIKVDAFLQKPFHIQQLNDVIEKISTLESD
jgi:hypothetical protein